MLQAPSAVTRTYQVHSYIFYYTVLPSRFLKWSVIACLFIYVVVTPNYNLSIFTLLLSRKSKRFEFQSLARAKPGDVVYDSQLRRNPLVRIAPIPIQSHR